MNDMRKKSMRLIIVTLSLFIAPIFHVLIYTSLCGVTFLSLAHFGVNPVVEPYGMITIVCASTVAAFLVSSIAFYMIELKWWITFLALLVLFNLQRKLSLEIVFFEAVAMLVSSACVARLRMARSKARELRTT
jgi:hypothetical protein